MLNEKQTSAVVLFAKNEYPEIAELIAHYTNLGADQIFIYHDEFDGGSTDLTRELLEGLKRDFPLTVIPWHSDAQSRQKAAYEDWFKNYGKFYKWALPVDSDEFLILPGNEKIPDLLLRHQASEAIALNWRIFGTSDIENLDGNTVMESFIHRAPDNFQPNNQIKSFVRPDLVTKVVNPHFFEGVTYRNIHGKEILNWVNPGTLAPDEYVADGGTLHHYVLRSEVHQNKRRARAARPAHNVTVRDEAFYRNYDRNDVLDTSAVIHGQKARGLLLSKGHDLFPSKTPPRLKKPAFIHLDVCEADAISGWLQIPLGVPVPETLKIFVDNVLVMEVPSNQYREDIERAGYNGNSAFNFTLPPRYFDGQDHNLRITTHDNVALNIARTGLQEASSIRFKVKPKVDGNVDGFDGNELTGWATLTIGHTTQPVTIVIKRDGQVIGEVQADGERPDVIEMRPGMPLKCGFKFTMPGDRRMDVEQKLTVQVKGYEDQLISGHSRTYTLTKAAPATEANPTEPLVKGNFDGFRGAEINGWAIVRMPDGSSVGKLPMLLKQDGVVIGRFTADLSRPDVLSENPTAPKHCGFRFDIPEEHRKVSSCVYSVHVEGHEDDELPGSRRHNFAPSVSGGRKAEWYLSDYADWRRLKDAELRQRAAGMDTTDAGKVSIVVPVYKPNLFEITEAVKSVVDQTYKDWELILVDDGNKNPNLAGFMAVLAEQDSRIKIVIREKNGGIADATNAGIEAAEGRRIAFMDQDDRLSPVALQVMLAAAKKTGAKLLHSDEGKLSRDGELIDPALKPDFDWRYLLGVNYICHFVMGDADLIKMVPLRKKYNGAQDHAFLLEMSEIIPHKDIHHVPEILYEWRMSAGSTAASTEAKEYAIEASRLAVADHLKRLGHEAIVTSFPGRTLNKVEWIFKEEPGVRIIIPFRDGIPMTRECLNHLQNVTDYHNFEVVLVDNGSTSDEARQFVEDIKQHDNVRVHRNDGPFNFSVLNNEGAALKPLEGWPEPNYIMLMNNDVFVRDPKWLRTMVNEAMVDPKVGIVGAKLLYEEGVVQHAGVVLGLGGVAGHAFLKAPNKADGYMFRARVPNQWSAVTAALMLIDAKPFRQLGGLDENLEIAFNDVKFCIDVGRLGYKVIMTPASHPDLEATHLESISRGADTRPERRPVFEKAFAYMQATCGDKLDRDPFYPEQFSAQDGTTFERLRDPLLQGCDRPKTVMWPDSVDPAPMP